MSYTLLIKETPHYILYQNYDGWNKKDVIVTRKRVVLEFQCKCSKKHKVILSIYKRFTDLFRFKNNKFMCEKCGHIHIISDIYDQKIINDIKQKLLK